MMGKGHFTKFTLLHAVIIHILARFFGPYCFDAAVLGFHNEAAVIAASERSERADSQVMTH